MYCGATIASLSGVMLLCFLKEWTMGGGGKQGDGKIDRVLNWYAEFCANPIKVRLTSGGRSRGICRCSAYVEQGSGDRSSGNSDK